MIRSSFLAAFRTASRLLRGTPLRRVRWVLWVHDNLFGLFQGGDVLVEFDGYRLWIDRRDRVIGKKLALYGEFEPQVRDVLLHHARRGTTALDVGANIGLHTVVLARAVGPEGRVVAFEPDPDNLALLRRNIELNELSNVVVVPKAMSNVRGMVRIFESPKNRGAISLSPQNVEGSGSSLESVEVEAGTIDVELRDFKLPISVVKIDVEGAEPLVLSGMQEVMERNRSMAIVFEFLPRFVQSFGVEPVEFLRGLEGQGFELYLIHTNGSRRKVGPVDVLREAESAAEALNLLAVRGS